MKPNRYTVVVEVEVTATSEVEVTATSEVEAEAKVIGALDAARLHDCYVDTTWEMEEF